MKIPLLFLFGALTAAAQPALTIYNQDFAVVRERVPLDLKAGENSVVFSGATRQLEPDSVVLRDPAGKIPFQVLEQSYRADTLSPAFLLSLYEGKELDFLVRGENAKEYTVHGKVIRSGYAPGGESETPIVEVDGKLRFSLPGEPLFPALSDAGVLKPTLVWQIGAERAAQFDAELGYVTGGMSWQAAYNFIAPEKGDTLDVVGWVTINNTSGKTFENATIKLMAGDVNKIQPQERAYGGYKSAVPTSSFLDTTVTGKAFDEFHLYSLPRAVTLHDRETKQVEFMRATGVRAPTVYVYDATKNPTKVAVMREFKNSEENGLGLPLPKGRTRFYRKDDADNRLEFVGEDTIDHTAKNETVRVKTGDAFDIVAERRGTNESVSSMKSQADQSFEIKLRSHKAEPVEVRVVEHLYSGLNWQITEKSDEFTKKDAHTIEFRIPLKPEEEHVVSYTVHYDWQ